MSNLIQFFKFPSFPFRTSQNEMIYVERKYNTLPNSVLRSLTTERKNIIYIPSVERENFKFISDDEFYDDVLPEIDDLYEFLDSAKVGMPFGEEDCYCWSGIPFHIYDSQSVDDIVDYGVISYTGQHSSGSPIFAYCSLVCDTIEEFHFKLGFADGAFKAVRDAFNDYRNRPILDVDNANFLHFEVNMGARAYISNDNVHNYRSVHHSNAYIKLSHQEEVIKQGSVCRKTIVWSVSFCQLYIKNVFDKYINPIVCLTPKEMAIYSFFVMLSSPILLSRICKKENNEYNDIQELYKIFNQMGNKKEISLTAKTIRNTIDNIEMKFRQALMRDSDFEENSFEYKKESDRRCAPFVIAKLIDRNGFGIPICCGHSEYKKYVNGFRKQLAELSL